ncbi:MAG TPA: 5-formyltetrahydrofolate cyclo-ligase [Thermohalobaculum sp.]|nr:5-formyltetrahydrofolate cyclo-ligase [Thermohalobaculum sp.]
MDTAPDPKAALRREVFARRREAHAADGAAGGDAARVARDHFFAARLHTGARVISGYRPIRTEIDPTPLMEALHAAGHRLCVPVIEGQRQPLRFREWHPGAAMIEGPFGAEIPAGGDWLDPELLIAPLVAFDARGHRLGYGGGYYDRTLAGLRAKRRTLAVGLAFAAQQVAAIPHDPTDQRLDAVVTERGPIRFHRDGAGGQG